MVNLWLKGYESYDHWKSLNNWVNISWVYAWVWLWYPMQAPFMFKNRFQMFLNNRPLSLYLNWICQILIYHHGLLLRMIGWSLLSMFKIEQPLNCSYVSITFQLTFRNRLKFSLNTPQNFSKLIKQYNFVRNMHSCL